MHPTLLIIEAGDVPAPIRQLGSFPEMFVRAANFSACEVSIVHARHNPLPRQHNDYDGILVSGSPAMVTDRELWSENLAAWLRNAVYEEARILGICYGHQLIAHALGGLVGYHPHGMELGTHQISLTYPGGNDDVFSLLDGLPSHFEANLAHSQTVLSPPREATSLAYSRHDPHQILGYGKNVLTLQFHPEFDQQIMRTYVNYKLEQADGRDPTINLGDPVEDTPVPRQILQRFIDSMQN